MFYSSTNMQKILNFPWDTLFKGVVPERRPVPGQSAVQGMEPGLRQAARTVVESFIENHHWEVKRYLGQVVSGFFRFSNNYSILYSLCVACSGILEQSIGARNREGIGLSDRPARPHRLVESIPWKRFLGSLRGFQIRAQRFLLWAGGHAHLISNSAWF